MKYQNLKYQDSTKQKSTQINSQDKYERTSIDQFCKFNISSGSTFLQREDKLIKIKYNKKTTELNFKAFRNYIAKLISRRGI